MNKPFIPFGIQESTGKLVDISAVNSGLDCSCICPGCGGDLVARKGDRKRWHFSHHQLEEDDPCSFAFEAGLRCMIWQELNKLTEIFVPCTAMFKNRNLIVDAIETGLEDDYPIDFIVYAQDACIAVCLTHAQHPFDSDLLNRLSRNIAILEIRLHEYYSELKSADPTKLKDVVLKSLSNCITSKYWRRSPDKCDFPLRPQYAFGCVTCGNSWQGHEYKNLCDLCCSPLMVLREALS
ncbi:competence protein CoiA family protein [Pseudidiomarina sp. E22-M8]|uniref:competence protein CoiA family protein n=1 Tax=Pseudidiomarina sp. E22-M8 TaxID=3424768 RepID=UPI00403C24D7